MLSRKRFGIASTTQPQRLTQLRDLQPIPTPPTNQHRALELSKAFDQWVSKSASTQKELTAKQMFDRITSKIGHLFKSLQGELAQVITDKGTYHDFSSIYSNQPKAQSLDHTSICGEQKLCYGRIGGRKSSDLTSESKRGTWSPVTETTRTVQISHNQNRGNGTSGTKSKED